ncbi:formyl transferase [candidate division KSB1 bacterium]|nr:MAG: formyl transferase [candidate division KSB1 bacterium]
MKVTPFHNPDEGILRVGGLMSGSGTNLRKIIEHQLNLKRTKGKSPYEVLVIFSDTWDSNANLIGKDYDIPVITRDIRSFYEHRGKKKRDLSIRPEFDSETVKALSPYDIKVAVYAGYMSIATAPLISAFLGINVHPADLSIEENGKRKYTGAHAVKDAILAGEKTISSSTHIIEEAVDEGRLLMISSPIPVEIEEGADLSDKDTLTKIEKYNQNRLKEAGDWIVFPKTIEFIAEGRFGYDENGNIYFDEKPVPKGYRL